MTEATEAALLWSAHPVRPLLERENAVHEISLPGGTRAALRLHRPGYQDESAIISELWWMFALSSRGLPVPQPIMSANGSACRRLASGRLASVVSWVDGRPLGAVNVPLAIKSDEARLLHHRLGVELARLHRASDALTLPHDFARPYWDADGLSGDHPRWGAFWESPAADARARAALLAARDLLRDHLGGLPLAAPDFGLIHADVLRENIFVNGHSVSLIDFDDSGFGWRLYDLGTVMIQNLGEPDCDGLEAALMAGYGTTDLAAVRAFTAARCLASVGWAATRLAPDHPVQVTHLARAFHAMARAPLFQTIRS